VNCSIGQTIGANADAWIDQSSTATNKGSDATLKIISKGPSNNTRALVSFGLPTMPSGCAVESVTLRMHLNALATDRALDVYRV
jgi:hypothetical protein